MYVIDRGLLERRCYFMARRGVTREGNGAMATAGRNYTVPPGWTGDDAARRRAVAMAQPSAA
jgi:hypothetical protein